MLCDTSALLAAFDAAEHRHADAVNAIEREPGPLVLSPFVLAEYDYMVASRLGVEAELVMLDDVSSGAYELVPFAGVDLDVAIGVVEQYRDLGIGLADASIVVLAERLGTRRIFTLDRRHFAAMRPLQGGEFELLPAA
ncbi:MAG: PIN domain-containing protein [Actinobacteria bacterium]|nr:PIN domain-containing protein [Actinomycetota bacterium]